MSISKSIHSLLAICACFLFAAAASGDIIIGPGGDLGGTTPSADGGGTRTNVDLVGYDLLPAGTYSATSFDVNAAQNGNVTPFLAVVAPGGTASGAASDDFTVIANGSNQFITSTGEQSYAFGGTGSFTLTSPTVVYAGVTNDPTAIPGAGQSVGQAVGFVNAPANDDHNSPGFSPSVGAATGTFSNPGLGREYAFDIHVAPANPLITIGPGTNIGAAANADGGGTRTNVDLNSYVTLAPGTYHASAFDMVAAQAGNATPFLAVVTSPSGTANGSATDNFTLLATGANEFVNSPGIYHFGFGNSSTFTLSQTSTIYAGITNDPNVTPSAGNSIAQAVGLVNTGLDDHNTTGFSPSNGATVGFTNPGLVRTYGYDVQVSLVPVPEPSSIALLGLGAASLLLAARRRKTK